MWFNIGLHFITYLEREFLRSFLVFLEGAVFNDNSVMRVRTEKFARCVACIQHIHVPLSLYNIEYQQIAMRNIFYCIDKISSAN